MIVTCVFFSSLLILVCGFLEKTARADDQDKVKVIDDWAEDKKPLRVDCYNLPIIGDGIGGAQLSCADRLSLYAQFSCFPMKKNVVKATCPEWNGLKTDIDWERVAELIDARADEEEKKKRELEQRIHELEEQSDSNR